MQSITVPIQLDGLASMPEYQHDTDSGADLSASIEHPVVIYPGERKLISTGLRMPPPEGYEWQIRPRSGLALSHGITVLNSPGTIDAAFLGIVGVILINHSDKPFTIEPGMRIAQAVLATVVRAVFEKVDILDVTKRGEGGFGSTGI